MDQCKHILIIYMLFFLRHAWAQTKLNDAVLWPTIAIEKKVTPKVSAKLISRARIGENISRLNSYYFDMGAYYEIVNNLKISLNFVYAPTRLSNGSFRRLYQYYVSINSKYYLNPLWFVKNRLIFQHGSSYVFSDNGYKPYSKTNLREKFSLGRKLTRRNNIYAEDEIMFPFKNGPFEIRRNRFYAGINHNISKRFAVDLYFVLQSIYHQKMIENNYIYGFTINYQF